MSSILKCDIKMGTIHDLGCRFEDSLTAAKREAHQHEGGVAHLLHSAKCIADLMNHVQTGIDDGKIDLESASTVKLYIERASNICLNLSKQAENKRFIAEGKIQAIENVVDVTKKVYESEAVKKEKAVKDSIAAAKTSGSKPTKKSKETKVQNGTNT